MFVVPVVWEFSANIPIRLYLMKYYGLRKSIHELHIVYNASLMNHSRPFNWSTGVTYLDSEARTEQLVLHT